MTKDNHINVKSIFAKEEKLIKKTYINGCFMVVLIFIIKDKNDNI